MPLSLAAVNLSCYVMSCRPSKDGKLFFLGCTQDFERMFTVMSTRALPVYKDTQKQEELLCRVYCGLGKDGTYKENVFLVN